MNNKKNSKDICYLSHKRLPPDKNSLDSTKKKLWTDMQQKNTFPDLTSKILSTDNNSNECFERNKYIFSILEHYNILKIEAETKIEKTKENPKECKIESGIKYCLVKFINFIRDVINTLIINNSHFQKENKKTIYKANSKAFTANLGVAANFDSQTFTTIEIFTTGRKNNNKQYKNYCIINDIIKEIEKQKYEKSEISKESEMLYYIFEMKYTDLMVMFVNSKEFNDFSQDPKILFFDKENKKQNGDNNSYCKKEGFIYHLTLKRKTKTKNQNLFIIKNNKENSNKINQLHSESLDELDKKFKDIDSNDNINNLYVNANETKSLSDIVNILSKITKF